MSISVSPTSISLASVERLLATAAEKFDTDNPQSSIDGESLRAVFLSVSRSEFATVEQHVFRTLIDPILRTNKSLASCLAESGVSSFRLSIHQETKSKDQRQKSSRNHCLALRADFCAYLVRKLLEISLREQTPYAIRRFYRFVEVLEKRLTDVRFPQHAHFFDTLLSAELSLSLTTQILVCLVLLSSSVSQQIVKGLGDHLRALIRKLGAGLKEEKDIAELFDCSLPSEFAHLIFASLLSPQVSEIFAADKQTLASFLTNSFEAFALRVTEFRNRFEPLYSVFLAAVDRPLHNSLILSGDHLLPSNYVDLEDKDLESVMDNLAFSSTNLLAQQIQEMGPVFTSTLKSCRQFLVQSTAHEPGSLNSSTIARIVVVMLNTTGQKVSTAQPVALWEHHSGSLPAIGSASATDSLPAGGIPEGSTSSVAASSTPMQQTGWNATIFVSAVKDLQPNLNWTEVIVHLDQTNFVVQNKAQLQLLTTILLEGLGSQPFPVKVLFRDWNYYKYGQLTWLEQIVLNPDVFSFVDYPHHPVNLAPLKVQPEDSRELSNWRVLEVIDTLLRLSSSRKLYNSVASLFNKPLTACPDVLLLGLLQVQELSPFQTSTLRTQYCHSIIQMLIGNHPNALCLYNIAWNHEEKSLQLRSAIISAFCQHYLKHPDDQSKLTRILEVAHELKPDGLAELFKISQFAFTIDLACLASRRDFLKLDKWIDDKLTEHGDAFATQVISYIRRRLPLQIAGGTHGNAIPQETLKTLLNSLTRSTTTSSSIATDLQQIIHQLSQMQSKGVENRMPVVSSARSQLGMTGVNQTSGGGVFAGFTGSPGAPVQQQTGAYSNFGFGSTGFSTAGREQQVLAVAAQQMSRQQGQQSGLPMFGNGGPNSALPGSVANPFGQTGDLLKVSSAPNIIQQSFGSGQPLSMSPSGQMLRTAFMAGTNSQSSQPRTGPGIGTPNWNLPTAVPGSVALRTTNPSDFRAHFPPGAPGLATGAVSHGSANVQQQQIGAQRMPLMAASEDMTPMDFNDDVQQEANVYFQQIYSAGSQFTINDFINRLKACKVSANPRDKEILACVVKNLFDEYRFFPDYPDKELRTTAEVYGGMIREGIITNLQFATAVRKVMESIQTPPGSRLWVFGIVALYACRMRLCQYPKVCMMIAQSETFGHFPENLKEYVTAGVHERLPANQGRETPEWQFYQQVGNLQKVFEHMRCEDSRRMQEPSQQQMRQLASSSLQAAPRPEARHSAPIIDPRTASAPPRNMPTMSATNIDTLLNATAQAKNHVKEPAGEVVDKVGFLFNNLSQINLPKKCEEMKTIISEQGNDFVRWLAEYLVMRRVSCEQNFQPLYNGFIQAISSPFLDECVKRETFRNIKILLRSEKRETVADFGDRQLLKNLGLWLGTITIARDIPIKTSDLNLKALLMEAYYKGSRELIFVIPFVVKTLLGAGRAQIFGPNCAWLKAVLKVLKELHEQPDMKLNLKFEIEVLCKELQIDMAKLDADKVLKDTDRLVKMDEQLCAVKPLKQPDMQKSVSPTPVPRSNSEIPPEMANAQLATSDMDSLIGNLSTLTVSNSHSPSNAQIQIPAHFHYHDINTVSLEGLVPHLKLQTQLPLFQMNPQLKHVVKQAMSSAIQELLVPVADRAIIIAMHVTEHICRKDFALDGDENRLRRASHHMIRAMTAGMAAITCRDPLANAMKGYLKDTFTTSLRGIASANTQEQSKIIDDAVNIITEDNIELATNYIVKSACERALPEMDKRMASEYAARKSARAEGRTYADPVALARAQQMPDKIRLRTGPVTPQKMAVYDDFSIRICGFKPTTAEDMIVDYGIAKASTPTAMQPVMHQPGAMDKELEQFVQALQRLVSDIDTSFATYSVPQSRASSAVAAVRDCLSQLAMNPRDPVQLYSMTQRLIEQMLATYRNPDNPHCNMLAGEMDWNRRLKEVFIRFGRILVAQVPVTDMARRFTRVVTECTLNYRFNLDCIELLVRNNLIQFSAYDPHLAQQLENGNYEAISFAQRLLKMLALNGNGRSPVELMPLTVEQWTKLQQLSQNRPTPDSLSSPMVFGNDTSLVGSRSASVLPPPQTIADRLHAPGVPSSISSAVASGPSQIGRGGPLRIGGVDDSPDSEEMQSKVEMILREWIQLCYTQSAQKEPQQALAQIVHVMHEQGVLSTDDMITRFFRLCTEMCVDVTYRLLKNDSNASNSQTTCVRQRCYYTLDAFVKLTCLMIKHSEGSQSQTKINLLKKVLNIVTGVLHVDHEVRCLDFQAMPYQRILIVMFSELTAPDQSLDPIAWNILEAFGQALFVLQPRRAPGFAFAWLDIIGHRNFIGRLLKDSPEPLKTAAMYTQLIICHLKFLNPFLRNIHITKSLAVMYKGTLRVLLVILHDFPELLCEYHVAICDVIPPNCVQLRNLILSAYPKNMRLPDPFGQNLKVESLPEMAQEPKMHIGTIPEEVKCQLDDYLKTRASVDFHANLPTLLQISTVPGSKYNTTLINALVVYVGSEAIRAIQEKQQCISTATIAHTAYMDVFQNLAVSLCTEGRYLLFNAITNQLRYPNSHTHYFSCTLLYLFLEANSEVIQEQITRILFERLVALRPHPWGLLITFIELIRNPIYNFWDHDYVRCAPEIERLFQSVANSCLGSAAAQKILASAAAAHQQRFAAQTNAATQTSMARSSPQSIQ